MLLRLVIGNLFSFKEYTEFNLFPGRFGRLPHHIYTNQDIEVLKLNAIYGANGAGKSNLVKALSLLRKLVLTGYLPSEVLTEKFKLSKETSEKPVYLGIEFLKQNVTYYYGLTIDNGIIIEEELQESGMGKKDDKILFIRKDNADEPSLSVQFHKDIESDPESKLYVSLLQDELIERNKPVLTQMRKRENPVFESCKRAFQWFDENLEVVFPESRPHLLALNLEKKPSFRVFANRFMKAFQTGVQRIEVETIPIEDFFGEDDKHEAERITAELRANPKQLTGMRNSVEEVVFVLDDKKAVAKKIVLFHKEDNGNCKFELSEESDGTRRLLEYLPALYDVLRKEKTFVVDEIERSIHPVLIKELIKKFSEDKKTKGQLIFTTHESNLLDQEIFRPDEIWFAEKNKEHATEFYPLSEFKEHHTIDIRKGYLNGRYGAIPFMANLHEINWEEYAEAN